MSENNATKTEKEGSMPSEAKGFAKHLEKALKMADVVEKRLEEMSHVDESRLCSRITI